MSTRKGWSSSAGRSVVVATVAILILTIGEPPNATAGAVAPTSKGVSATTRSSDATDFSSARRRRYYRGGSAAALGIFGMAIGTIGAIAAQQNYGYGYGPYYGGGPYYYGGGPYYYGGGPYYYGGGPYYYGGGPYYGRRYYRYRHW
jgi:hypothetical protein